jgi:hypothetical protein
MRIEYGQILIKIPPERWTDGPGEPLDRQQARASRRSGNQDRRLAERLGEQVDTVEEGPQADSGVEEVNLSKDRAKLTHVVLHRAEAPSLGHPRIMERGKQALGVPIQRFPPAFGPTCTRCAVKQSELLHPSLSGWFQR